MRVVKTVAKHGQGTGLQVEFICPQCGRHLAWALPGSLLSCPGCGMWVNDANRRKEYNVYLPSDDEQMVLFNEEE